MAFQPTVLCIKWGTAFGAEDVNVLHRACRTHTNQDLRFVCLTDNPLGLDNEIEVREIPDIGLTLQDISRPGVWRKLSLYAPQLHDLGRVLFIDLDMMIVGPLDPFFEPSEGVTFLNMGDSWRRNPKSDHTEGGTAIFSYNPAEEHPVLLAFLSDPQRHMAEFHNEQDFVFAHASKTALWPEGRVISFKRHLCRRFGAGLLVGLRSVPAGVSVIAFHGKPRPRDVLSKKVWGPFPHFHRGLPLLLKDYWKRFSNFDIA